MKSSAKNIKLTSYDELFEPEAAREDDRHEKVMDIPLTEVHHFRNHPFQVRQDQALLDMAESIREYGVLSPGLARPMQDDGYEVISGSAQSARRDPARPTRYVPGGQYVCAYTQ